MGDVPEQVFLDAAVAFVRACGGTDGGVKEIAGHPPYRAAVASAYRAGYEQAREDEAAAQPAIGWTETDEALHG